VRVVGRAANQTFLGLESGAVLVHDGDEFLYLRHRLGTDAVTWEEEEFFRSHAYFPGEFLNRSFASRAGALAQDESGETRRPECPLQVRENVDQPAEGVAHVETAHAPRLIGGTVFDRKSR